MHGPECRTLLTLRPSTPSKLSSSISADVLGSSDEALVAVSHIRGDITVRCTNPNNTVVVQQLQGDKPPRLNLPGPGDELECAPKIDLSELLNVFGRHLETEMYHDGRDQYPAPEVTLFIPRLAAVAGVLLLITLLGHEGDIWRLIKTLTGRQEMHPVSEKIETETKEHTD